MTIAPRGRVLALLGCLLSTLPAQAHHSYAAFDQTRKITMKSIVKLWQFSNPHSYLWVYQCDDQGKPLPGADGGGVIWPLEGPGPAELLRHGWDKDTVKPGDVITVAVNPLHDGRTGGSLVDMKLADGRDFYVGGSPTNGPAPAAKTP